MCIRDRYKVMGLSAYGTDKYADLMKKMVAWDSKKGIQLNPEYLMYYQQPGEEAHERHQVMREGEITLPPMWSDRLKDALGEPRKRGGEYTQRDNDIACSLQ